MKLGGGAALAAALASAIVAPALAQSPLVGQRDTPRHAAANAAASRAINICSGLWSGGQSLEQLEADVIDKPTPGALPLKTDIDRANKVVLVSYDDKMPPRIVVWRNVMGCVQLPVGASLADARYLPQVAPILKTPNLDDQPWPTGDRNATEQLAPAKRAALDALVKSAFDGKTYGGVTWGVIVVKDGKIVAEHYERGFDMHMGSQTHSAAKSFASSLVGIASAEHLIDMKRPGALKEWRRPGDPRGQISIEHLIHMSSGLYGEGTGSPQSDIYFQGGTVADRAATNMLDTVPGTRFLYNPPDTMLMMRAVREGMNDDKRYWSFPYQALFWKVGMTRTTTSGDWNGDFLMSGQTWSTARDFARFGLLYLNDGMWDGKRVLPAGWAKYVATPGPVQPAGNGARYGGHFWLYGGQSGLPDDAFSPNGGQGQYSMIIRSKGVVVVRRGYDQLGANNFQIAKFSADVLGVLGGP